MLKDYDITSLSTRIGTGPAQTVTIIHLKPHHYHWITEERALDNVSDRSSSTYPSLIQ